MKQLHHKIEAKKRAIHHSKMNIREDIENIKKKIGAPANINFATLGGLLIGFLFLPKKLKVLRFAFKAYTVVATAQQILELLPHQATRRSTAKTIKRR